MANYKKNQQTVPEVIVLGLFRGLWWLVTLPFRKKGKVKRGISNEEKNYIRTKRNEILDLANSDNKIELKHAVLEADKLVDFILKLKGCEGETFADRLRAAEKFMDRNTYESVWYAHKIRNQIAHDNGEIGRQTLVSATQKFLAYIQEI
ncbi:MAG: hypothetical protein WC080_01775 [Patescibacteria group bacterium]|jgi:hypothetical protein